MLGEVTAIPGVPAADLSGADLLKAWPSMEQLGAVLAYRLINVRLSAGCIMNVRTNAVDGVPQYRQSRLLTGRGQEYAAARSLARVRRELPVRLDQERTDMVVAMVIPACRTSWWTLKLFVHEV